jgi:hypothetical protein
VAPDTGRREFFRRLLADLAHPPGTHTFFPACLPGSAVDNDRPVFAADPEIFWSALRRLGGRALLVLGEEAARALALEDMSLWTMTRQRGLIVWRLPETDAVVGDENLYSVLLEFLRAGLRDMTRGDSRPV